MIVNEGTSGIAGTQALLQTIIANSDVFGKT